MAEYIESLAHLSEQFAKLGGVGKKSAMRMAFSVLELSEEDAEKFAAENKMKVQSTMKLSFLVRNIIMLATLVLAFLLPSCFDVIATLIPLVSYRIILMIAGMIKRKTEVK